ncbi:hypothetical protein VNO78_28927 [Psophocarpus tetragonolobus]|uniref:Uncharacterized protein n=1 Tax=Psophocarpus tetragonolobus TaxID=3891 RepID=A0AAN9RUB6_PSOTE
MLSVSQATYIVEMLGWLDLVYVDAYDNITLFATTQLLENYLSVCHAGPIFAVSSWVSVASFASVLPLGYVSLT